MLVKPRRLRRHDCNGKGTPSYNICTLPTIGTTTNQRNTDEKQPIDYYKECCRIDSAWRDKNPDPFQLFRTMIIMAIIKTTLIISQMNLRIK